MRPARPRRNWTPFLVGLAASVGLTALLWALGFPGLFLFLLLPLLLWPRRHRPERACPACGYTTLHPAVRYCPHDGTRMEPQERRDEAQDASKDGPET